MSKRTKNEGRIYLRRSTDRQEASLPMQLQWGISEAKVHSVELDASLEDLDYMIAHNLQQYKGMYLDNGITGSDLNRAGFVAFQQAAISDPRVSHAFIHMSDRFARPELAVQAMQLEIQVLLAGVTVVFSNRVSQPRQLGNHYFAEDMQLLYEYSQNGEYLTKLSQRVVETSKPLAAEGYWRGGTAPYGFIRVLVDPKGDEIRELADGETVKMEGCHVRIKPKFMEKIRVWLLILELHGKKKWGHKRIANYLNYELGIPSPNAGKQVRRNGKLVTNTGRWWSEVVKGLIKNKAIIGLCVFGKTASGKHRRLGPDGPRLLEDSDRNERGGAKRVFIPEDQQIIASTGFEACADEELFRVCQELTEERGRCQRGIRRASDPAKYPLSTRIVDLTPTCGALLYGRAEDGKVKYECSRYRNSGGKECARNVVDGEAALRFVMGVLRQRTVLCGGRTKLREKLMKIAATRKTEGFSLHNEQRELLQGHIEHIENELKTIESNMALAASEAAFRAIEKQFAQKQADLESLQEQLRQLPPATNQSAAEASVDSEVESAMALFEDLCRITRENHARSEIAGVLERIDLKLGLRFMDNPCGKRPRRVVQGGIVTIGPGQNFCTANDSDGDPPPKTEDGIGDLVSQDVGESTPAIETCQPEEQSFRKARAGKRPMPPKAIEQLSLAPGVCCGNMVLMSVAL